jgi:hypothetical protein
MSCSLRLRQDEAERRALLVQVVDAARVVDEEQQRQARRRQRISSRLAHSTCSI